jgi:hypothetical protein
MKLENSEWRFDSPGALPREAVWAFDELVGKIVAQGPQQPMLEHFKEYFTSSYGGVSSWSSSASWAESDLNNAMTHAADNAPMFIDAFYEACEALRSDPEIALPSVDRINRILTEHNVPYLVDPPLLRHTGLHAAIVVPASYQSLDQQAQELIQKSFEESERLLGEGRHRQAVQEVLWLMETVSTAFRGLDAGGAKIEEKYFNKIAERLKREHKGTTFEQVLHWLTVLHGYLSSPTGGGIRHGTDLNKALPIGPNEARLFCNLIRSYVMFLMAEYARLSAGEQPSG